ncbi:MAG: sodium:alanine symporter family protein [Ruminococcaceae bacterium]|nr:sodium:alanine symporter family protein [Oscillospiraceae bacterium]
MELISAINAAINDVVWGPIMLTLLIGAGLFLSIKTGFLQFRKFGFMLKNTILSLFSKNQHEKDESGVSPFQAVATAMAGTIGTGSIAGLATAIVSGGPGAVFWMWVSALLGMVTKYAEIVLSLKYREKNEKDQWVGGPMYYLKNGLNLKWLAGIFAVFAMIACLGTGNATQSNSIAVALESTMGVEPWITGIVLTVIAAAVILGGMRRIASVNEKLVPFMAVFYVVCSVVALFLNIEKVPAAFALIFREAFNFKAAAGGATGYGIMLAMHYGFSRGVFSNEAGLGSAPIAHAASSAKVPSQQGFWGMFEVFFTTIIICTLSAVVILTSGLWDSGEFQGSALSIAAFDSVMPKVGGIGVTLSTIFFALSTILGWAYYGEVCTQFLFHKFKKSVLVYRTIYVIFVFVGAVGSLDLIWSISETMNGLMAIPNLIGIVGLSKVVSKTTKEYFEQKAAQAKGGVSLNQ